MKTFSFDPAPYAARYAEDGYAHVRGGVTAEFLDYAREFLRSTDASLGAFEFKGKKQQFLFEFPGGSDWPDGVKDAVAAVTGLDRGRLTLCERHVKAYERTAAERPAPHKDRLASEVAVGIPLHVASGSTVVLYPHDWLEVNPFNTAALWRESLDDDELPERVLRDDRAVEIDVRPGDVLLFRGSSVYHERRRPAGTAVLYLKFNAMELDPLGEDPATAPRRQRSVELLEASDDGALLELRVAASPRLHRVSRHYSRLRWTEVVQACVADRTFRLTEDEFRLIRAADGVATTGQLLSDLGLAGPDLAASVERVRRLVRLEALDLLG